MNNGELILTIVGCGVMTLGITSGNLLICIAGGAIVGYATAPRTK